MANMKKAFIRIYNGFGEDIRMIHPDNVTVDEDGRCTIAADLCAKDNNIEIKQHPKLEVKIKTKSVMLANGIVLLKASEDSEIYPLPEGFDIYIVDEAYANLYKRKYGDKQNLYVPTKKVYAANNKCVGYAALRLI